MFFFYLICMFWSNAKALLSAVPKDFDCCWTFSSVYFYFPPATVHLRSHMEDSFFVFFLWWSTFHIWITAWTLLFQRCLPAMVSWRCLLWLHSLFTGQVCFVNASFLICMSGVVIVLWGTHFWSVQLRCLGWRFPFSNLRLCFYVLKGCWHFCLVIAMENFRKRLIFKTCSFLTMYVLALFFF